MIINNPARENQAPVRDGLVVEFDRRVLKIESRSAERHLTCAAVEENPEVYLHLSHGDYFGNRDV
ncbi:hypothetical protein MFRU_008g02980 [Monilinia fructicola]|nr:hypothetical protein MFRU_008g02980 [Monilinia fructicola]